jgi:YidC/Oxa1 family membrane protein insertase
MNRNTILGLVLIFGIFVLWGILMPKEEELLNESPSNTTTEIYNEPAAQPAQSTATQIQEEVVEAEGVEVVDGEVIVVSEDEEYLKNQAVYGSFVNASKGQGELVQVENDVMKLVFNSHGGRIHSVELKDYNTYDTSQPVILFDSDSTRFGFVFLSQKTPVNTNELYFEAFLPDEYAGQENIIISNGDSLKLKFRLYPDASSSEVFPEKYLEFEYTVYGDQYMIDYALNTRSLEGYASTLPGNVFKLDWLSHLRKQERTQDRLNGTTIHYREDFEDDASYSYLSENSDDSVSIRSGRLRWVSMKQRFFATTLIMRNGFLDSPTMYQYTEKNPVDTNYLQTMEIGLYIPVRDINNSSNKFSIYTGPLKYKKLRKYDLGLERQIPLGWGFPYILSWINRFAVIPVFDWLGGYGWNYGIVILVLTLMLKLVLFPIAYKTYRSTAKMRVLKPEIDEISKKFPKKEDSMKKQQATMALYKKAGVNPMAGCVPMLLQFPILIAMFRFFPASIELRQQPFLWATDLSSYDTIATLPFSIDFGIWQYGPHVSLFTLLMTVSTILYTWMNNQMMSSSQQMPGMKTMMYLMPVMFLGIFNNYASGLSYYYLLANLITFGQMFIIRHTINEDKLYQKLQANKKKVRKQSGFQKRLEDAAKKRNNPKKK